MMRFLPSLNEMFDDVMFDNTHDMMACDVVEHPDDYELTMAMPGCDKDNIHIDYTDGYLNVAAESHQDYDETDEDGYVIRQERSFSKMGRSFYVGEGIDRDAIKASYDQGELHITLPKNDQVIDNRNYIAIE